MKRIAIIAGNANDEIINNLEEIGFTVIKTIECIDTYEEIMYHPDIVITKISDNEIIIDPKYYDYYKDKLDSFDISIYKGYKTVEDKYPKNIIYNAAIIGENAIHNFKYTDRRLTELLKTKKMNFINVNQGYTKCSTVTIANKAIITSDKTIYTKSKDHGIKSLLIDSKQIILPGFEYGFIGGASGFYKDTLYFTGKIDTHSSRNDILSFLEDMDIKVKYLSNKPAIDLGSIIFL